MLVVLQNERPLSTAPCSVSSLCADQSLCAPCLLLTGAGRLLSKGNDALVPLVMVGQAAVTTTSKPLSSPLVSTAVAMAAHVGAARIHGP